MLKRVAAVLMAVFLLAACQKPAPSSTAQPGGDIFTNNPVRTEVEFEFKDIEDSVYTMVFEPITGALTKYEMGMNMPPDIDADWLDETEHTANFHIMDISNKTSYAWAKVITGPPDPESYYKTKDPAKLKDHFVSQFFPTADVHAGLKKAIVDEFGYKLVVDWTGTALGMTASYIEFIDEESNNHGLRFYMSNDKISENYYALEYKADLPIKDSKRINDFRNIIFSLHGM